MDDRIIFLLLASFFQLLVVVAQHPVSQITVAGVVYCDVCSTNSNTTSISTATHTYFLSGVDVHIQCKFKTKSAKEISISANRTTDKSGLYKLEIPSLEEEEEIECIQGHRESYESSCQAMLIEPTPLSLSSSTCNTPSSSKTTSHEITIKSERDSSCIYSLNALTYTQQQQQQSDSDSDDDKFTTLCTSGNDHRQTDYSSFNSSKFFLPFFPPFGLFPWPFFPCPSLPRPPSLPFPFPPLPPFPNFPLPPIPPGFNLGDPRTWIPGSIPPPPFVFPPGFNIGDPRTWTPSIPPPPFVLPPGFNIGDPRTWTPSIPPPPFVLPPGFNIGDPRTWIPYLPPPPNRPTNEQTLNLKP